MKFFTRASKTLAESKPQQLSPAALTREILSQIQNERSRDKLPMFALALSAVPSTDVSYILGLGNLELESWRSDMPVFDDEEAINWWMKDSTQYIACLMQVADRLRIYARSTRNHERRQLAAEEAKRMAQLIAALSYLTAELNPSHVLLTRHFVQLQNALSLSDERSSAFQEARRLRNEYFIEASSENLRSYIAAVEKHFTPASNTEGRVVFRGPQRAVTETFKLLAELETSAMLQELDS